MQQDNINMQNAFRKSIPLAFISHICFITMPIREVGIGNHAIEMTGCLTDRLSSLDENRTTVPFIFEHFGEGTEHFNAIIFTGKCIPPLDAETTNSVHSE